MVALLIVILILVIALSAGAIYYFKFYNKKEGIAKFDGEWHKARLGPSGDVGGFISYSVNASDKNTVSVTGNDSISMTLTSESNGVLTYNSPVGPFVVRQIAPDHFTGSVTGISLDFKFLNNDNVILLTITEDGRTRHDVFGRTHELASSAAIARRLSLLNNKTSLV